ncbi:MAG: EscU/YscU/HrcU family type III secretion system export apparatus switch protein [Leptospirales bacterium]|nr:EscU/YscU/HrcU family type III secretion system export apparatus switch protein [Leptospirales bacterium]
MEEKFFGKSIALQYDKYAPKVIASAMGFLAEKMVEIAKEKGIPVYKDADLAEILYKFKAGDSIPESLFNAVSVVMAYCYRINSDFRQKVKNSGLFDN